VIGLLINFLSEAMALIAHVRLIKLNARLEVTESQWATATMIANKSMIVADSTLSALNHVDHFAHTFKMPFNILNEYQNNGKRYGEFVNPETRESNQTPQEPSQNSQQIDIKQRYDSAMSEGIGSTVGCPVCLTEVTKRTYNHVFCSSTGANNCKDEYHNILNPARIGARR
jgi:hypothetical protein